MISQNLWRRIGLFHKQSWAVLTHQSSSRYCGPSWVRMLSCVNTPKAGGSWIWQLSWRFDHFAGWHLQNHGPHRWSKDAMDVFFPLRCWRKGKYTTVSWGSIGSVPFAVFFFFFFFFFFLLWLWLLLLLLWLLLWLLLLLLLWLLLLLLLLLLLVLLLLLLLLLWLWLL